MNNEPVAWKAYEEVHFNDQYILRWVREGDEYVNKITKEMMEDLKSVVRQQQAELDRAVELYTDKTIENEALKKSHIELERGIVKDLNQRQMNEPVAWMFQGAFDISTYVSIDKPNPDIYPNPIPLYTHPVKEEHFEDEPQAEELHEILQSNSHPVKELTDEEIVELIIPRKQQILDIFFEKGWLDDYR